MAKVSDFIAMIPARIGSTRLKMKNLALIDGRPMISYAIHAAQASGVFDHIVLNSDHEVFQKVADRYGVEFYHRPASLGSSTTKSDDVVMDFIRSHPCRRVAWVNPTSPLQTGHEIKLVIDHFVKEDLDSLITIAEEQVHCVFNGRPVNFDPNEQFAQTQDLIPVGRFVYSIMAWRAETFTDKFKRDGFAFFCGRTGYFPVSKFSALIIKREEDLMIADLLMRVLKSEVGGRLLYDELAASIEGEDA